MRVISRKALREFWSAHPAAEAPLRAWERTVKAVEWANFAELRQPYPSADLVGRLVVFNVHGNKFRLVAAVHFNKGIVFVRNVLTHAEYDRGKWREG